MAVDSIPLRMVLGGLSSGDVTGRQFQVWFGGRLRAAREAQGLTLPALAHLWPKPIDPNQIGAWERGEVFPRSDKVATILTLLETTPEDVFCESR